MCEARTELPEVFVPAQRPSFDVIPRPPGIQDDFPKDLATITPESVQKYDKEALLLVGSRGVPDPYGTFSLLENWLRFPTKAKEALDDLAENSGSQLEQKTQRAAEYLVTLRLAHIDPPPPRARPEDRQPDKNLVFYKRFDFFRDIAHETERNPGEPVHSRRLMVARMSIFAAMLYAHESGLQITVPSRVHSHAARRPGNLVRRPNIGDELY